MLIFPHLPHKKGVTRGTPGHPTPWPRDARTSIRPLGNAHFPMPTTQKRWNPRDTKVSDPLAAYIIPHLPHKKMEFKRPGRISDPLAVRIVPYLPRKRGNTRETPGRTFDPLVVHIVTYLVRKRAEPESQGVYPTLLAVHIVPRLSRKRGGARGTPGCLADPLVVLIVPHLREKRRSPRDARVLSDPFGSAHCPTPATQKRRSRRDARAYIRSLGNAHCPMPARHD